MNTKFRAIFRGKVVNKAHTINTGVDEFPRYVVEYLIDNYCPRTPSTRIWKRWLGGSRRRMFMARRRRRFAITFVNHAATR